MDSLCRQNEFGNGLTVIPGKKEEALYEMENGKEHNGSFYCSIRMYKKLGLLLTATVISFLSS